MRVDKQVTSKVFRQVHRVGSVPAALMGGSVASSAFDDIWGWYRADNISGASPTMVFTDISGNSRHATQTAGTLTSGTATNGQARVTGNASATLTIASDAITGWPLTVITVAKRAALATAGFFGASGANAFNKYWYGFESTNRFAVYNTAGTLVTDTSTNDQYAAYMHRGGYGCSIGAVNNLLKITGQASSVTQSATSAIPSIGTTYRGLNCDWQETLVWNRQLSFAEMDEVNQYLNERYGFTIPMWSGYTQAPSVAIHGQSNASGRGDRGGSDANIPLALRGEITGALTWHGVSTLNTNNGLGTAFETINVASAKSGYTGNHMFGDAYTQPTNYFGLSLTMASDYLTANGGSIYLNQYTVGGTPLAYNAGSPSWSEGDSWAQSSGNRLWTTAMQNYWAAVAVHQAAGRAPDLRGIVWYQGEQDAANLTMANAYEVNLASFLGNMREEYGFPDSKLLLCRLNENCPETYAATVIAAQNAVALTLANCVLVDTDSYEIKAGDPVHLSHNGQIALGQFLATQL